MAKQDVKLKESWILKEKFPGGYLADSDFSDLERQLLFTRGIKNEDEAESFLTPKYDKLHNPFDMKGVSEAVERIKKAVSEKEKAVIYGDYDVDGITATIVLHETLEQLGLEVGYYIPKRDEGYGLNKEAVEDIYKNGGKLIVTVDCGVTAVEEVEYAQSLGLDVIVTDHHSIHLENGKEVLPKTVVINSKQKGDTYPYKELSGVGVAFKLAQALYREFPEKLQTGQEKWLLDLVLLGTVCDVVPLTGENRALAHFGLKVIKKTKRAGLRLLSEASGCKLDEIDSYKVGFHLGPRLNAAGRLETAEKSIKLLLSKDINEARLIALELNKLNQERQYLTQRILEEAIEEVEKKDTSAKLYLLKGETWPAGVVGIVASKLVEKFKKPVIICEDRGHECQGSARSPKCFNIIEALEESAEYLLRYGGHARAAGITVKKEHFILLENKLLEISGSQIKEKDLQPEYKIDSVISLEDISENIYKFLKKMEPFGLQNPMPVFMAESVEVTSQKRVGKEAEHMKFTFKSGEAKVNGIYFSFSQTAGIDGNKVDIMFQITENEWGGRKNYEARCIGVRKAK